MADKLYILRRFGLLDDHGQLRQRSINAKRLSERTMDELLGICKAITADGVVSEEETAFLISWLKNNATVAECWPANVLAARIEQIMEDGIIDPEERTALLTLLREITGAGSASAQDFATHLTTTLPLTKPAPPVFFKDHTFCFTGHFFWGTRQRCEGEVVSRGGLVHPRVTQDVHYLVLGTLGSTDWIHSTHGRKIEYAIELREKGLPIALISEQHWTDHLL